MTTLVDRVAGLLEKRTSRRGFLARSAVVGSALAVAPVRYATRPASAYDQVCGTDASCAAGYTVFCVTVNNGVNRCPPGSLVGGWWKSDGSGFCCGGARYYIDCHSFCSCGCGPGVHFCGEGCRNCSAGCGPAGQCDQRRVCANDFRYGQCNQDVSCTGPVWCRVVTCTPPWAIPAWKCTSTSAVDQRTNGHTAPGLLDCTAIGARYTQLGGQSGVLGEPRTGEQAVPGGARTLYDFGGLWWTPSTGAHAVVGAIGAHYVALGAEQSPLLFPTTDEAGTPDGVGRYNHFQNGSVYWTYGTGAWSVVGAIHAHWAALGWETSVLGYPVTDELGCPDGVGRYNHFQRGSIYWTPSTGAWSVVGAIHAHWAALGWERSALGYPLTDEGPCADGIGRYNHFQNGSIYWTPQTGAFSVVGAIYAHWAGLGWERSAIGYPLTDEGPCADGVGRYNHFQNGSIYWTPSTGAWAVVGAIHAHWQALGYEQSALGYPLTDETASSDGVGRYSDFQNGTITWSPSIGAFAVQGVIAGYWRAAGRETSPLGYPVADEQAAPGRAGARRSEFTHGSVYWSLATGAHSVSGPIRTAWLGDGGSGGPLGLPTSDSRMATPGTVRQDFQGGRADLDVATGTVRITLT